MELSYDLVVYGSTSGAVAVAITAARLGRTVALVSPQQHIGGIQINGLGATDIDNQAEFQNSTTLGGISLEFHERISRHYGRSKRLAQVVEGRLKDPEVWRFESKVAEEVISQWLSEYPSIAIIKSRLRAVDSVNRTDSSIRSICLEHGNVLTGKVFVEATYEGDLLAASDIPWTIGRESSSTYNESLAGIRGETLYRQIEVDIDPHRNAGEPSSGLLYGISDEAFGIPGDGDLHLQSYSYRVPLTDTPENRVPFTRPDSYDPAHYELHRRYFAAGGKCYVPKKRLPGEKTDLIGSESALSTDLLGMNDQWPAATYEERNLILSETAAFTKGLFWFFATDAGVPEECRAEWSRFGYCRDEFPDNNHFPRELYVRDGRRMVSDCIVTEATATRDNCEQQVPDPIAVAYWPTDTHSVRRIMRDGRVHNEGFIFKDGHKWRPFGVSYRALIPRRSDATNFISVTCPSASHVGYGAIRLEHQFYAIGQACANACDIAITNSISLQDVPYEILGERLASQGVVLDASRVGVPQFPEDMA
ncbi:hypothetical protein LTS10_000027 [Elasticomyces elasticus]|nr:hypothetical protein LTS10_000027 [Elasticomyces elasticus]